MVDDRIPVLIRSFPDSLAIAVFPTIPGYDPVLCEAYIILHDAEPERTEISLHQLVTITDPIPTDKVFGVIASMGGLPYEFRYVTEVTQEMRLERIGRWLDIKYPPTTK